MENNTVEFCNIEDLFMGSGEDVFTPAVKEQWAVDNKEKLERWRSVASTDALWLSRLPDDLRRQLNPAAQEAALSCAGAEVRGLLAESSFLEITLSCPFESCIAEVYQGDAFEAWHIIGPEPTTIRLEPASGIRKLEASRKLLGGGFDPRVTRLLLPYRPPVRVHGIYTEGQIIPAEPHHLPPRRWLAYGSSITHGESCIHPSGSYAARAAQRLGVDLKNLGFGGGAHLEPEIAEFIAAKDDWDFATFELGINVRKFMEVDEFACRVARFIETVASANPEKPIICIDLFTNDDDVAGGASVTSRFRRVVKQAVAVCGHRHVHYLNGRRLLASAGGLSTDLVHPSPQGMEDIGERLARALARILQ